jgi:ATP-dependent Clp protease adaptor protein ClpS
MAKFGTHTQEEEDILVAEETEKNHSLILYNDDVNSFDHVIETLIKICRHDPIQAEQCTYLIHYTGKCAVKEGPYTKLEPMCTAILERGITACIE